MNERIKQLAERAEMGVKWGDPNNYDDYNRAFDKWQEKFAELIVRECGEYLMRPEFIGRSDLDWSMVLNEYFGVEE